MFFVVLIDIRTIEERITKKMKECHQIKKVPDPGSGKISSRIRIRGTNVKKKEKQGK
jgi:hypothetical protein